MLLESSPVIVTSCVGAYQLSVRQREYEDDATAAGVIRKHVDAPTANGDSKQVSHHHRGGENSAKASLSSPRFPLVVLDEAAQCTEPGLCRALVASEADQLVLVGDTKQLPPTVASSSKELRDKLGVSPMDRLEPDGWITDDAAAKTKKTKTKKGHSTSTLRVQYRMAPALMEFPSNYFYDGLVTSTSPDTTTSTTISESSSSSIRPVKMKAETAPSSSSSMANISRVFEYTSKKQESSSTSLTSASTSTSNLSSNPLGFTWPATEVAMVAAAVDRIQPR